MTELALEKLLNEHPFRLYRLCHGFGAILADRQSGSI